MDNGGKCYIENKVPVDDNSNFRFDFKNENHVIDLLLNKKKD